MLISGIAWLRGNNYLRAEAFSEQTVCIVVCTTVARVWASVGFNLSFFALKFMASLFIWPRCAVIMKARVHLE
jgi:hypothetical protein